MFNYRSGLDAAEMLLAVDPAPDGDLRRATTTWRRPPWPSRTASGLDVPGDLTVAGFDDAALATTIWPELTTVRQPIIEMARRGGRHPRAPDPRAPRGRAGAVRARRDGFLPDPAPVGRRAAPAPAGRDREPGLTRSRAPPRMRGRFASRRSPRSPTRRKRSPSSTSTPTSAPRRTSSCARTPARRSISASCRSSRSWRACRCSSPPARDPTSRWWPTGAGSRGTTSTSGLTWTRQLFRARVRRRILAPMRGGDRDEQRDQRHGRRGHAERRLREPHALPPGARGRFRGRARRGTTGPRRRARSRRPRTPRCRWRWTAPAHRFASLAIELRREARGRAGQLRRGRGPEDRGPQVRRAGIATARCRWISGARWAARRTWTTSRTS